MIAIARLWKTVKVSQGGHILWDQTVGVRDLQGSQGYVRCCSSQYSAVQVHTVGMNLLPASRAEEGYRPFPLAPSMGNLGISRDWFLSRSA